MSKILKSLNALIVAIGLVSLLMIFTLALSLGIKWVEQNYGVWWALGSVTFGVFVPFVTLLVYREME